MAERKKIGRAVIEQFTKQALAGNQPFREVFEQRFKLFRPSFSDIAWLAQEYLSHITPGAKEAVAALQASGHRVSIVSASYRPAILGVAKYLAISALDVCAIDLEFAADGSYANFDADNILITDEGQGMVLAEIRKRGPVVFVADAERDARQRPLVDCFIGFGGVRASARVAAQSDMYIKELSLFPVVSHVATFLTRERERADVLTG
jgi:phosphoserine phosphatase